MLKELLLDIYRFFNPKAFQFEHLGHVTSSVLKANDSNQLLAGIYTTGLYSSALFVDHPQNTSGENIHPVNNISELSIVDVQDVLEIKLEENLDIHEIFVRDKETIATTPNEVVNLTEDKNDDIINIMSSNLEIPSAYPQDEEIFKEIVEASKVKVTPEEINLPLSEPAVFWEKVTDPLIDNIETPNPEPKKKKKKKVSKSKNNLKTDKKLGFQPSDFSKWVSDLASIAENKPQDLKIKKKKKKKKSKKKLSKVELSAKQSITLTDDIASETLASLLASQGHIEEAKEMYKKLITLYPDKKDTYNQIIEDLDA